MFYERVFSITDLLLKFFRSPFLGLEWAVLANDRSLDKSESKLCLDSSSGCSSQWEQNAVMRSVSVQLSLKRGSCPKYYNLNNHWIKIQISVKTKKIYIMCLTFFWVNQDFITLQINNEHLSINLRQSFILWSFIHNLLFKVILFTQ